MWVELMELNLREKYGSNERQVIRDIKTNWYFCIIWKVFTYNKYFNKWLKVIEILYSAYSIERSRILLHIPYYFQELKAISNFKSVNFCTYNRFWNIIAHNVLCIVCWYVVNRTDYNVCNMNIGNLLIQSYNAQ